MYHVIINKVDVVIIAPVIWAAISEVASKPVRPSVSSSVIGEMSAHKNALVVLLVVIVLLPSFIVSVGVVDVLL